MAGDGPQAGFAHDDPQAARAGTADHGDAGPTGPRSSGGATGDRHRPRGRARRPAPTDSDEPLGGELGEVDDSDDSGDLYAAYNSHGAQRQPRERANRAGIVLDRDRRVHSVAAVARPAVHRAAVGQARSAVAGGAGAVGLRLAVYPADGGQRNRVASNSFVRLCRAVAGSSSEPMNVSAAAATRYQAGASGTPVRTTSHPATRCVVPPIRAMPILYTTESTVQRTRHGASSAIVAGIAPLRIATSTASPISPAMIPAICPRAISAISG